jgi:hypothetical protein
MYIVEGLNQTEGKLLNFHLLEEFEEGPIKDASAFYVNREGFMADAVADPVTEHMQLIVYIGGEIISYGFEDNDIELQFAEQYDLTHYAFCLELAWDDDGQPSLRSDDQHMVLGTAAPGDWGRLDFEPFVTIVNFEQAS